MVYQKRHIEDIVRKVKNQFPVTLITGPRQVGKSTLLSHVSEGKYDEVSFDDPIIRLQAENDPNLFLKNNLPPILIDEIQYVPELFPYIKIRVDQNRQDGDYLITGSHSFVLMKNVSESLAGRVGLLDLQGVSLREIHKCDFNKLFIPTDEYINKRSDRITSYNQIWSSIHRGYMPELVFNPDKDWEIFYSSYFQTYIERDVRHRE